MRTWPVAGPARSGRLPWMAYDELREDYPGKPLLEGDVAADPVEQFRTWFDTAVQAGVFLANGMTLATAGPDGAPSSRVVLLKDVDERGFVFFTNYDSRKGREIDANAAASLTFWWPNQLRQVCIAGVAERVPDSESDEYFHSRPRASNLSAMASDQSAPIDSRQALETAIARVEQEWEGRDLERPGHWGGYRLVHQRVEFWQGRLDRAHDRLEYQRVDGAHWTVRRLYP